MESYVEIICIGNELLIGKTMNTNAHWLARRITGLGLSVRRITVIRDDVDEIASSIREAIQRRPCFIITTGGLGPTFDDKTLAGVSSALGLEMEVNEDALEMIKSAYQRYVNEGRIGQFELTPPRIKMATLPRGGVPLPNPVGTAPGVLIEAEGVKIVILPGVPREMMAIFDSSVEPLLRRVSGDLTFYESSIEVLDLPESDLAPLIEKVMTDNPYVYIKSHPQTSEKTLRVEIHLSTTSKDSSEAMQRIGRAIMQISEMIKERGGKIRPKKISETI
ncbi:MAG: nicotinamide mononucleotide deamidase-related protein [Nitrososphaerota archaeon]|nr:nicotinamide mononucleotide deamidase-related protein [Nitrososphaerota archaeon]